MDKPSSYFSGQYTLANVIASGHKGSRCCCAWVLRRSLTCQVISVAFYIEREKSGKFCSKVLISAKVLLRAVKLRHWTNGFSSLPKEVILNIFTLWKIPSTPDWFETANLGSSGQYDNHGTTGVDPRVACSDLAEACVENIASVRWDSLMLKFHYISS